MISEHKRFPWSLSNIATLQSDAQLERLSESGQAA
jgi:hypothetical protein